MKEWIITELTGSNGLKCNESNIPVPEEEEVVVKVAYAGVNYPDLLLAEGKYQFKPTLPFSPGAEVSGHVYSLGSKVTDLTLGDPVMAFASWGGYAEYIAFPRQQIIPLTTDTNLSHAASLIESYGTAYHALVNRGNLVKGEKIVILGAAGGVGLACLQIAKKLGAHVLAQVSTVERASFLQEMEEVEVITGNDILDKLKAIGGVDIVVDPVGGSRSEQAFRSLKPGGRHLVVGFTSGQIPALPWNLPLLKSASIIGVYFGGFWRAEPVKNQENLKTLIQWLRNGDIKPRISKVLAFDHAPMALEALKKREILGKWIINVNGDKITER